MNSISTKNSVVYFNSETYTELNKYIQNQNPSKIFILVDTNTHEYCLPQFLERLESNNITVEVMEMPDGEDHKTIDICKAPLGRTTREIKCSAGLRLNSVHQTRTVCSLNLPE